jgi:glycosyltransferase involved in cell wall biosynthesis
MRKEFGIKEGDLVFLQATRIVRRKAIELAIDLVAEVKKNKEFLINKKLYHGLVFRSDNKIYLVFAGKNEDEDYYRDLLAYADQKGVQILDISKRVNHERTMEDGVKKYSLWDAYSITDIITYPSILEGWGNQFLEGIAARLPIVVYKYPVFLTDIEKFGFNVISLGSTYAESSNGFIKVEPGIIEKAVEYTFRYLLDPNYRRDKVEANFKKGCERLSLNSLKEMLRLILKDERN